MHEAIAIDQRLTVVLECRSGDGAAAREDVFFGEDAENGVHGLDDACIVERNLVEDPLVIHIGTVLTKNHVFDPVGVGPASCLTGLDAEAKSLGAASGGDRVNQCAELVEGGWNLVASVGECLRLVPDEGLEVGRAGHTVLDTVDIAEDVPGVAPVGGGGCCCLVVQRLQHAIAGEASELSGPREERDVRRVATFDLGVDIGFPVGVADLGDCNAVGVAPYVKCGLDGSSFALVALGSGDRDFGLAFDSRSIGAFGLFGRCGCCFAARSIIVGTACCGNERKCNWDSCRLDPALVHRASP